MTRLLSKPFFNWLQGPLGKNMLETISNYSSLSLGMAGDSLKIYFQGGLILSIPPDIATNEKRNLKTLSRAYYEHRTEPRLKEIIKKGVTLSNLQEYLDCVIGVLSRRTNHRQEEQTRQEIAYVNNRSRIANDTDYFIVDQEYGVVTNKTSKFDLVAIKWPSIGEVRKRFSLNDIEIVVFELKFGLNAVGGTKKENGKADLKCHIEDFNSLKADVVNFQKFKRDIIHMFIQQSHLDGFYNPKIGGLKNVKKLMGSKLAEEIAENINVKFGFILADYKQESSRLKEQINMFTDDFLFARSSFMGYGLYDNEIFTRKELEEILK